MTHSQATKWIRKKLLNFLHERDAGRCYYCERRTDNSKYKVISGGRLARNAATIDHLIPECMGGELTEANCVLACHACNNERGKMDAAIFMHKKRIEHDTR